MKKGYHSGGGSYVLSRESLRRFYQAHQDPKSGCPKDGGNEDVEVTTCLSKRGVYPGKSLDEYGRELFHPLSFENHFRGNFPPWLIKFADNPLKTVSLSFERNFHEMNSSFSITIVAVNKPYLSTT